MAKQRTIQNKEERTRVNLILNRSIWGKIRIEAFEERKSASALINEIFEEHFKNKKARGIKA
ncbi:MAG: hypothetical protein ABIA76_01175 [Candidatus Diapherotrites archaeon]